MRVHIDLAPEVVRPLTDEDLEKLEVERATKAPAIKRLSERHHALARALALGASPWEAAIMAKYSTSRVSILQADPTFAQLVEWYRESIPDREFISTGELMAGLNRDTIERIYDRVEEEGDTMRVGQLLEIAKYTSDRTGFGPSSQTVNVQVDLAARLSSAMRRLEDRGHKIIEAPTPRRGDTTLHAETPLTPEEIARMRRSWRDEDDG